MIKRVKTIFHEKGQLIEFKAIATSKVRIKCENFVIKRHDLINKLFIIFFKIIMVSTFIT